MRGIDDCGALVADERRVDPGRIGIGAHGAVHAAGRDDDVDPGGAGGSERRGRPRPQHAVLPRQRPVEVARDRGDVAREAVRERQRVDSETYAATSAISCSLRLSANEGIAPWPLVTRWVTSEASGWAWSKLGPTVPDEPAASSV